MIAARSRASRGSGKSAQITTIPAPIKGIDTRQSMSNMAVDVCLYNYNLIPASYGMSLRKGYREYVTKLLSGNRSQNENVGTIISTQFTTAPGGTLEFLFAVTNKGIFEVSYDGYPPTQKLHFSKTGGKAGHGTYIQYTDEGGHQFVFYADEENGLFVYEFGSGTWKRYDGINGFPPEDIVFITVHKQRVWICQRGTAVGWYLPVASVIGGATPFYFGSKFTHGGNLVGLYNWTVDGGSGVDDHLVAISSTGDVLPYQGADPSSADSWNLIGSYYIGRIPKGRRICTEVAGDLLMLSVYGVTSITDLLRGVDPKDISKESLTYKISDLLKKHLRQSYDLLGWEVFFSPLDGMFIVTSPIEKDKEPIQYVMDLVTNGWGLWRGMPIRSLAEWRGGLFFGGDTSVYKVEGYRDCVKQIDDGTEEALGRPIEFSMLTSFQSYGESGLLKAVQYIRPTFIAKEYPFSMTKAVYEYVWEEIDISYQNPGIESGMWDISNWDKAVWATEKSWGVTELHGASGLGRSVAIAIKGAATSELRLVSFDVIWKIGGMI